MRVSRECDLMPAEDTRKSEALVAIGQTLVTARRRSGLSLTQLVRSTRNPRLSGVGDKFVLAEKGTFEGKEDLLREIIQAYHLNTSEDVEVERCLAVTFPKTDANSRRSGVPGHPRPSLGGYRPSA